MDAGHAYNTFPLMGGKLIPEEYWTIPSWRNAFENTAAVQFHHRLLALTTLSSVAATWLAHRRAQLPGASRHLLRGLVVITALQVTSLPPTPPTPGHGNRIPTSHMKRSCISNACRTYCDVVVLLQVTLGITTLLTYVPPSLGSAHQATALALFSTALALLHSLRPEVSKAGRVVQMATPATAFAVLLVGAAVVKNN